MWPGSAYWFFLSPAFINTRSLLEWHFAGEAGREMRFLYQWVFFPLRKEENPFKDHFRGQSSCPESCASSRHIQLCSRWLVEPSGCCSNYNHAFHLNPQLADTATCASTMRSCFGFSYFLSWLVGGCPLLAFFFPQWVGKGRILTHKSGISLVWEN